MLSKYLTNKERRDLMTEAQHSKRINRMGRIRCPICNTSRLIDVNFNKRPEAFLITKENESSAYVKVKCHKCKREIGIKFNS